MGFGISETIDRLLTNVMLVHLNSGVTRIHTS